MSRTPSPRTVVEAFLVPGEDTPLGLVYDTANAVGLDDQPVRLALRRMVASGDLVQTGRGRHGTIALTDAGAARLAADRAALRLAFAQDRGTAPWDGRWRLLAVSVAESERHVRDTLRRTLTRAGAASVSTGLLVSPHDLADLIDPAHRRHLVRATTETLDLRGVTAPREIAETLWPATTVLTAAKELDADLAATVAPGPAPDPVAVLAHRIHLADALERSLREDPLLPPELRPRPWPPRESRRRWLCAWSRAGQDTKGPAPYRGWLDPHHP